MNKKVRQTDQHAMVAIALEEAHPVLLRENDGNVLRDGWLGVVVVRVLVEHGYSTAPEQNNI